MSNNANAEDLLRDLRQSKEGAARHHGYSLAVVEISGGAVQRVSTSKNGAVVLIVDYDNLGPMGDDADASILAAIREEIDALPCHE